MSNSFIHKVGKSISHCYKVTIERFSEFGSYASNPKYFPKVSIAVIVSSGFAGFCAMQIVDRKREQNMAQWHSNTNENETISEDETLVRAMVENAKSLSPRENLENAVMAQKNFMLIPFDQSVGNGSRDRKFIDVIARRSEDIKNNRDQRGS